jgi:hypothetical protein
MNNEEARQRAELRDLIATAEISVSDAEFERIIEIRSILWRQRVELRGRFHSGDVGLARFERDDAALDQSMAHELESLIGGERYAALRGDIPEPWVDATVAARTAPASSLRRFMLHRRAKFLRRHERVRFWIREHWSAGTGFTMGFITVLLGYNFQNLPLGLLGAVCIGMSLWRISL